MQSNQPRLLTLPLGRPNGAHGVCGVAPCAEKGGKAQRTATVRPGVAP